MTRSDRRQSVTVDEIRKATFLDPQRYPMVMRWVSYPLSWWLTVVLSRLGCSPYGASMLRLVTAVVGAVLLGLGLYTEGAGCYLLAIVLDNTDGSLSRVYNTGSYLGKYIDGLFDELSDLMCFIGIGLGAWWTSGQSVWLILTGLILVMRMLMTLVIFRYAWIEKLIEADDLKSGRFPKTDLAKSASVKSSLFRTLENKLPLGAWDIKVLSFVYLAWSHNVWSFLLVNGVAQGIQTAFFVPVRFAKACGDFRIYRKNNSARNGS